MKNCLLLMAAALSLSAATMAQSLERAKKEMYYKRYASAKEQLKAITAGGETSPEAWYWLGEVYLEEKQPDAARAAFQSGLDLAGKAGLSQKKSPLIYVGMAHYLMDAGKFQEAKALIDEVLEATKNKNADALLAAGRANVESKQGDARWAIVLLDMAAKRDKKNPEIYSVEGDAYRKLTDGSNAIINYNKALDADARYAEALYKKGRLYKSQNNPDVYLEFFTKAYMADSAYAPALYELYDYYFYRDVDKAAQMLEAYIRHSDPSPDHAYMRTDLAYIGKKYDAAIKSAQDIISRDGDSVKPRIYKLLAYCYAGSGDSTKALDQMNTYFAKQDTTDRVVKDYLLAAALIETVQHDTAGVVAQFEQAVAAEKDSVQRLDYLVKLAEMEQKFGRRDREAIWREKIYKSKPTPNNLDLYNWGMACYAAQNYPAADTVFGLYTEKYPDQTYGYLWRARANALIDTTMELGLAVPHYTKLIEVASQDTAKNASILITAYGYLGSYEANVKKDYPAALQYFDRILALDPDNKDAARYADTLKKWISDGQSSN